MAGKRSSVDIGNGNSTGNNVEPEPTNSEPIDNATASDSGFSSGNANNLSGDKGANRQSVDPATIGEPTPSPDAPVKRGRGRPPGSGNKSAGSRSSGSTRSGRASGGASKATDSLTSMMFSAHMMMAAFTSISELAITEDEAKQLAEAITGVTELYDMPLMDEKTAAWLKLAMAGGTVYGTRIASLFMAGKAAKKNKPQVVSMPSPFPGQTGAAH